MRFSKNNLSFLLFAIILFITPASLSAFQDPQPIDVAAPSATFDVNSTADLPDLSPGNGLCQASNGQCTLRAAVEETNALAGMDTINIPAGTYLLDDQLVLEDSVFFTGAGKNATLLDGQDSTEILKVRTVELLVCDSGNDSVASYDRNGQRNVDFLSAGAGGMDIPGAIAIGPENDVFVTAYSSGVHRFSSTGANKGLFVDPADYAPAVFAPTDGIFGDFPDAPNLDFYVADYYPGNRILRYDRLTGNQVDVISGGGLEQPNNLAFYNDDLFVTSVTSNQVLRYDGDTGNFISVFINTFPSGSPTALDRPRGLVFHNNALYVANEESDSILKFNASTGAYQSIFVSSGSGGLDKPSDLVFGPDGDLYVISRGNQSILRYNGQTGAFKSTFVTGGDIFLGNPACLQWRTGAGDGPIVNISGMTLRNGRTTLSGGPTAGLDIDEGASVAFWNGAIRNNDSSTFGGGIQNWGNLDLRDMEITGNSLPEGGGGQTSQGGGIFNAGNLELNRVSVNNNFATRGGGISNVNDGRVEITNSTISDNTAFGAGGGIRNVVDGRLFINHSTIVNNSINGSGSGDEPTRLGGGIYNSSTARVDIANSIVAENDDNRSSFDSDYAPDCYSETNFHFTSHGRNIIGILNENCTYNSSAGDQTGDEDDPFEPLLGSLSNGVHMPFFNSPAVDAGSSTVSDPLFFDYSCRPVDQLGHPRPIDGNINGSANCDVGAAEYLPPQDNDGIDTAEEDGAPNGGDGNADGIPDSLQPNVASFTNAVDERYVTIVAPNGTTLQDVQAQTNAAGMPVGVFLPFGRFEFAVNGAPAGSSATVLIILPEGTIVDSYYKYGPTSDKKGDHWYEFLYDGTSGARLADNRITIIFVDGQKGDSDLTANRRIVDPGAPAVLLDKSAFIPLAIRP